MGTYALGSCCQCGFDSLGGCDSKKEQELCYEGVAEQVHILRDEKALEVFINQGEASYSYWI